MPYAQRGAIYIAAEESDQYFDFIQQSPGYKKILDNGIYLHAATAANVRCFQRLYPTSIITDIDRTISSLDSSKIIPITPQQQLIQPQRPNYQHQNEALDTVICRETYAFWDEQGCGKSCEIIQAASELFLRGIIKQALIVTKKLGRPQFLTEQIPMHIPINIKSANYSLPRNDKIPVITENKLHIAITTDSTFQCRFTKCGDKKLPSRNIQQIMFFCKRAPTALFIDESQSFKGWNNLRFDNMQLIAPLCIRRYLYSGEPKPNNYLDFLSQFFIMDKNILGHKTKTSFQNEFCEMKAYPHPHIHGYKNEDRLVDLISPHCRYKKLADCVDMPEQIFEPPSRFEPTAEQSDLYQQVKETFVATVKAGAHNDQEIKRICQSTACQLITMSQIANGWFYGDRNNISRFSKEELGLESPIRQIRGQVHIINDERAIFAVSEKIGSDKCIVWCAFHEDLASMERILTKYNIPFVEFSGRVPENQMEANKLRFQNDPKCQVFLGTQASGGTALNLQCANHMGHYSDTYNYGDYDQAIHRIWRISQRNTCHYWSVAGFGIDYIKRNNLREKKHFSTHIKTLVELAKLGEQL